MRTKNSNRFLPFYIFGALFLLAILEGFWLTKVYHDERDLLKREIERTLRDNVLMTQLTFMQKNNVRLIDSFFNQKRRDTSDFLHFIPTEKLPLSPIKNGEKQDKVTSRVIEVAGDNKATMRIIVSRDSGMKHKKPTRRDSFLSFQSYEFKEFANSFITVEEVKLFMDSILKDKNLRFEVYKLKQEQNVPENGDAIVAWAGSGRRRFLNDEKIGVAAYGYKPLIFSKLVPEMAFALLVFSAITAAFWFIYRSLRQQERLAQIKNDFINNITHELKTPITTVGVAIEALSDFDALKNPAQTEEYLDISKKELARLSLLVDNVLKMSIFEQSDVALNREDVDLAELTAQVLDSMKLLFEHHKAAVDFEVAIENVTTKADQTHLTSVFYNLIENALKYGGKSIKIGIENSPEAGKIRWKISDDGEGIPPQYLGKIFDKFFRIPKGNVHNVKGHGLGLSYVASVVQKHGGSIGVESKIGVGSTFTLDF